MILHVSVGEGRVGRVAGDFELDQGGPVVGLEHLVDGREPPGAGRPQRPDPPGVLAYGGDVHRVPALREQQMQVTDGDA